VAGQAGYSGTPLSRKLGIGEDDEVAVIGAPNGFADRLAAELDGAAMIRTDLTEAALFDVIVVFVTWRAELEAALDIWRAAMAPACGLWIAWPKRTRAGGAGQAQRAEASGAAEGPQHAARVPTDLTENVIREVVLPTGLVDNKVCAIDQTWSALRLVIRKELRRPVIR
jgi:hypothetical protein